MKFPVRIPYLLLLLLMTGPRSHAANTGLAVIGYSAVAKNHQAILAECYVEAGGNLELASLYYSFDRSKPMIEIDDFVRSVLPRLIGRLTIKLYLDSGPNRRSDPYGASFRPNVRPAEFWRLAAGRKSDPKVKRFYSDWNDFIQPAAGWVGSISQWATAQRLNNKLEIHIVPVLEDDAGSNLKAYRALAKATKDSFNAAGLVTAVGSDGVVKAIKSPVKLVYFRNPNGTVASRRVSGLRLEGHGSSRAGLKGSDALSADGVDNLTIDAWGPIQHDAIRHKVTALFWHPSFNGGPREVQPDKRGELRPFDAFSKAALVQLLKIR